MRGPETEKSHEFREEFGFYKRWCFGKGADIGYGEGFEPVLESAKGIEKNDWIDGKLPFEDNSLDYVFSSHCLEHITDPISFIRESHRVLKEWGRAIIIVPHQFLYEKKKNLPSRYNEDHKRFYTPGKLLTEVESALKPNTYRVMALTDNDRNFDYSIPPEKHSSGCYEICLILIKIKPPEWDIT